MQELIKTKNLKKKIYRDLSNLGLIKTKHKVCFRSALRMENLENTSINLVITSPPYPMIEMWDGLFSNQNLELKNALEKSDGLKAFNLMHEWLNTVWSEVDRILVPGGIVCVNIGDATRTIGNCFQLFPSHAKIIESFLDLRFQSLPGILWRKQTNAPNKFMGSGMLPPGAYVTLEHEHILIFRKGAQRKFSDDLLKKNRRESAYFWEERNVWFSDVWDFKGIPQELSQNSNRERSAAFPFELAYRLINMFSSKGEMVLDPFLGTGTTMLAAMASERNSIGYEIDESFQPIIQKRINSSQSFLNDYIENRINSHVEFTKKREQEKGPLSYTNKNHNFHVITNQETELIIRSIKNITNFKDNEYEIEYTDLM